MAEQDALGNLALRSPRDPLHRRVVAVVVREAAAEHALLRPVPLHAARDLEAGFFRLTPTFDYLFNRLIALQRRMILTLKRAGHFRESFFEMPSFGLKSDFFQLRQHTRSM